jgi:hypothetical protein
MLNRRNLSAGEIDIFQIDYEELLDSTLSFFDGMDSTLSIAKCPATSGVPLKAYFPHHFRNHQPVSGAH